MPTGNKKITQLPFLTGSISGSDVIHVLNNTSGSDYKNRKILARDFVTFAFTDQVYQASHGFSVTDAIKLSGSTWIKAQADDSGSAGTIALVSNVLNASQFDCQYGGILTTGSWTEGVDYFLSPYTGGAIIAEPDYATDEVREFVGTGTANGDLYINIDLGDIVDTVSTDIWAQVGSEIYPLTASNLVRLTGGMQVTGSFNLTGSNNASHSMFGNVGIGTEPVSRFHVGDGVYTGYGSIGYPVQAPALVSGTPAKYGDASTILALVNSGDAYSTAPKSGLGFAWRENSGNRTSMLSQVGGGKENTSNGSYASYLYFVTSDSSPQELMYERMRITSDGKVAIGTTTPSASLHIDKGTGSLSTGLAFGDGDTGFYENAEDILYAVIGGNTRAVWSATSWTIGDGTTGNPNLLANAAPTSTSPAYRFYNDWDTGIGWAGADQLSLIAGGVEGMRISSSGYIGVGTDAPKDRLHVMGNVRLGDGYSIMFEDTDQQRNLIGRTGNTIFIGQETGYVQGILMSVNGATNALSVANATGNVGIGKTGATARLDVNGDLFVTGSFNMTGSDFRLNTANHAFRIYELDSTHIRITNTKNYQFYAPVGYTNKFTVANDATAVAILSDGLIQSAGFTLGDSNKVLYRANVGGVNGYQLQSYSAPLGINALGNDTIINPATGNVGIGQTSPGAKLAVNGDVQVTGSLKVTGSIELAGSLVAPKTIQMQIIGYDTVLATGDGQGYFCVTEDMDGYNLSSAHAFVTTTSSLNDVQVQVRNHTDSVDMLTTPIYVDAGENTSYTALTASVVDTANDDVATGDLIRVDVDGAGTGAKGLGVILKFTN